MDDTWIVVANQTDARILAHRRGHPLYERETLVCPEARQPERAMFSDTPGRSHDRQGPGRHALEPHTAVGEQLAARFGHRVARHLDEARKQNAFRNLVLVAALDFLGVLRGELGPACRQRVVAECRKNIVTRDIDEIVAALPAPVRRSIGASDEY